MSVAIVDTKVVKEAKVEFTATELDAVTQSIVDEFVATRSMITALEKKKKALEADIREALGDAEVGLADGKVRIEVSPRTRVTIDSKELAEAFPEAYASTHTVTEYSVLMVK